MTCELLIGETCDGVEDAVMEPLHEMVYAIIRSMALRRTHGGRLCPVSSNHEFCIRHDAQGKKRF
jgi:hypothetical protein